MLTELDYFELQTTIIIIIITTMITNLFIVRLQIAK